MREINEYLITSTMKHQKKLIMRWWNCKKFFRYKTLKSYFVENPSNHIITQFVPQFMFRGWIRSVRLFSVLNQMLPKLRINHRWVCGWPTESRINNESPGHSNPSLASTYHQPSLHPLVLPFIIFVVYSNWVLMGSVMQSHLSHVLESNTLHSIQVWKMRYLVGILTEINCFIN